MFPRTRIWNFAIEYWIDRPWFGVGPGHLQRILSSMVIVHAHNNVIHTLVETGVLPALIVVAASIKGIACFAKSLLFRNAKFWYGLSLLPWLTSGLVETHLFQPQLTLFFAIILQCITTNEDLTSRRWRIGG